MTKKQFAKALNAKPLNVGRVVKAQDKFNGYLDRNPDILPIYQAFKHALDIIMESCDGQVDGQYTTLIPDTKVGRKFRAEVRQAVAEAYRAGLV